MKSIVFVLFSCIMFASDVQNDPSVLHGKLSNGLTYYISKDENLDGCFDASLIVKTGSLNEREDEKGLAHFTEHMVFGGTKNFEETYSKAFKANFGKSPLFDFNAQTGIGTTEYFVNHGDADCQMITKLLHLLNEMMFEAKMDPVYFERERNIVLSEHAMQDLKWHDFMKSYMLSLGLKDIAESSPLGQESVLRNATVQKICDFYQREYRPDKMALIVSSNMDCNDMLSKIQEIFIKTVDVQAIEREPVTIEVLHEPKVLFYSDKTLGSNQIELSRVHTINTKNFFDLGEIKKRSFYAFFNSLIGRVLNQKAVESKNYGSVEFSQSEILDDVSCETIHFSFFKGKELEGIRSFYSDLNTTVAYLNTKTGIREVLTQYNMLAKQSLIYFRPSFRDCFIQGIDFDSVASLDDLSSLAFDDLTEDEALTYLQEFKGSIQEYNYVALLSTHQMPIEKNDVHAIILEARNENVLPVESARFENLSDLVKDYSCPISCRQVANDVQKKWEEKTSSSYSFVCKNGLKVEFDSTNCDSSTSSFTSPFSHTTFVLTSSNKIVDSNDRASYDLVPDVLRNSGLLGLDSEQLRVYLSQEAITMNLCCLDALKQITIESYGDNTPTVFRLLQACFDKKQFKKEVFDYFFKNSIQEQENLQNHDGAQFANWMDRILYNNHSLYTKSLAQDADFTTARNIAEQLFYNPKDFTLYITGDENLESLFKHIITTLSPIKNREQYLEEIDLPPLELGSGDYTFYHSYPQESWGYVYIPLNYMQESSDRLSAKCILSTIIQDRLFELLRVDKGLSYTQYAYFTTPEYHQELSYLHVYFTSRDEHIAFMHECTRALFLDIFANGISEAEFTCYADEDFDISHVNSLINELRMGTPLTISKILMQEQEAG